MVVGGVNVSDVPLLKIFGISLYNELFVVFISRTVFFPVVLKPVPWRVTEVPDWVIEVNVRGTTAGMVAVIEPTWTMMVLFWAMPSRISCLYWACSKGLVVSNLKGGVKVR